MLRRPFPVNNVKSLLKPKRACNPCEKRHSSGTGSSGGRKFFVSLVGASTLGVGGTIAYAKYDSDFRKALNNNIPFAETVLIPIIGSPENEKPLQPSLSKPSTPISVEDSLLKKKLERSKARSEQENVKISSPPPPPIDVPKAATAPISSKSEPSKPKVETGSVAGTSNIQNNVKSVPISVEKTPETTKPKKQQELDVSTAKPKSEASKTSTLNPISSSSTKNADVYNDFPPSLRDQYEKIEELEKEFEKKVDFIRDEYEKELTKQLKRQMAAHLDHLKDQLEVQKAELERRQSLVEEDKILSIKDKYYAELSGALNKLSQIEAVLKAREKLDEEEIRARKLWLLCQSLKDTLKCNGLKDPVSLKKEIDAMMQTVQALSIHSSMTSKILGSIPKNAVEDGIYNEDSLIERFNKVDKLCKRVALIGDEGGTLYQYFLSYLQSMLIIDSVKIPEQELSGTLQVDPSQWDTFEVLARVRYCLSQRNIEQALRYANQLRGAPRKIAKDWIKDTRTHLEVRQATELLQALAATITLRAVK